MKGLFILLLLLGAMIFVVSTTKKTISSEGYKPTVVEAPADVDEYPPKDAIHHGDGLYSRVLEPATSNIHLKKRDFIKMEYIGWRASDGQMIDNSKNSGKLFLRRVDEQGLIEGWKRILPLLKKGEKRRLWIPQALAYGDTPNPLLADSLVFDIKIVDVIPGQPRPIFEQFSTEPTAEASVSKTGFKSLITNESEKTEQPTNSDLVLVHITKWDQAGEMVSSTVTRQRPTQLDLANIIPALAEGIPLMKVGESRRFWIPQSQISNTQPQQNGDWVYDIELLSISK